MIEPRSDSNLGTKGTKKHVLNNSKHNTESERSSMALIIRDGDKEQNPVSGVDIDTTDFKQRRN